MDSARAPEGCPADDGTSAAPATAAAGLPASVVASALELTGDAVLVVDSKRRIIHCSEALLDLLDRTADEVIGQRCVEGIHCLNCESRCPLFDEESVCQRDAEPVARDGAVIHVVKNGRLLRDAEGAIVAGVETIRDVSDLHAVRRQLATEAERLERDCTLLRAAADHSGEGLVTIDRDGRVTCLTAQAAALLGADRDTARGGTLTDLLVDDGPLGAALAAILIGANPIDLSRVAPRLRSARAPSLRARIAAIPDANGAVLESELFGHTRGAFTGADRDKPGQIELCGDGTLLLDEVGCLPLSTQAKLLRVLEQREYHRIGGTRTLRLRARVVAATNAELERHVQEGRFRADLYYRLRVIPLHVPPLRERPQDVAPLARHFAESLAGGVPVTLDPAAVRALESHRWPGNVRELRNAIQYAVATRGGGARNIGLYDLPPEFHALGRAPEAEPGADDERARLEHALVQARYNRSRAARLLGVSRSTLWRKMGRLGMA